MFSKIASWLVNSLFTGGKIRWKTVAAFFLVFVGPFALLAVFSYINIYKNLTGYTLARRTSVAYLAATTLEGRLNQLKEVGVTVSKRGSLPILMEQKKWGEAVKSLGNVIQEFPFVKEILLADPTGKPMAALGGSINAMGETILVHPQPYISEIYQSVVAVSIPVQKMGGGGTVGVLVLQVGIDTLIDWVREMEVGQMGFVYFIDKKGNAIVNPNYAPEAKVADYSKLPIIQKLLQKNRGVELLYQPTTQEERLAAFEPVRGHDWGVMVQEPSTTAFAERNASLRAIMIVYVLIFGFTILVLSFILRALVEHKKAEEMREQLIHVITHELRSPVATVKAAISNMKDGIVGPMNPKQMEMLNIANRNIDRLTKIISDLLDIGRFESGKAEMHLQNVPLKPLVKEVTENVKLEMQNRQIVLKNGSMPDGLSVYGDPDMILQLLNNLMDNAVRFARSEVVVDVRPLGNAVQVDVKDDGPGIPKARMGELFNKFVQVNRPTGGSQYKGTGLGLAICKQILKLQGGKIWVHSEEGKGTTFHFTLPAAGQVR
ncbi:MAG: ATP-binding protein [Deltaproteobacteria bacterium]|nr:ATP-binding protein [Deltaproteobacteria bacterium]